MFIFVSYTLHCIISFFLISCIIIISSLFHSFKNHSHTRHFRLLINFLLFSFFCTTSFVTCLIHPIIYYRFHNFVHRYVTFFIYGSTTKHVSVNSFYFVLLILVLNFSRFCLFFIYLFFRPHYIFYRNLCTGMISIITMITL